MSTMPILRLELQQMQQTVHMALHEYMVQLDADIQQAITDYCTPATLTRVIEASVSEAVERVIREEVERFYRVGQGRKVIREAVEVELGRSKETHG